MSTVIYYSYFKPLDSSEFRPEDTSLQSFFEVDEWIISTGRLLRQYIIYGSLNWSHRWLLTRIVFQSASESKGLSLFTLYRSSCLQRFKSFFWTQVFSIFSLHLHFLVSFQHFLVSFQHILFQPFNNVAVNNEFRLSALQYLRPMLWSLLLGFFCTKILL